MSLMKRREFIAQGSAGLATLGLFSGIPARLMAFSPPRISMPIGFQSYVLREDIGKDLTGTLNNMAAMGYEYVEMCSPSGYMGPFAPLAKYSGSELKSMIEDTGMKCTSSHFTFPELKNNLDDRIEFSQQLGLEHVVLSSGLHAESLDQVKENCAKLNEIGEKVKAAGMVAAFHNHDAEFKQKFNGKPEYDYILEELDPDLVKMQFQTQVIVMGYKASDYFKKYPGRFISAHLQDYATDDLSKEVVLGKGIADWKDFFKAARIGGVEVAYVEMESDPATLKGSVDYLSKLKV